MLHMRTALVVVIVTVAAFAASVAPASAVYTDRVVVVSPNGGAKLTGTLYWYSKRHWEFRGYLADTDCNSHDVYMDIFKNRRYAWDHYETAWHFWSGTKHLERWRHSVGCNTSRLVSYEYADTERTNHDVEFNVCDDGFSDSCSNWNWPWDWYGAYHNPYASW